MHQTTIRFGSDLWEALAVGASAEGVSVAQYVRESAVERLARTGGPEVGEPIAATDRRRDARAPRRAARVLAGHAAAEGTAPPPGLLPDAGDVGRDRPSPLGAGRPELFNRGVAGRRTAMRHTESSAAVWAQSRLARARARELRAESRALIAARRAVRGDTAASDAGTGPREDGAVDAPDRTSRAAT